MLREIGIRGTRETAKDAEIGHSSMRDDRWGQGIRGSIRHTSSFEYQQLSATPRHRPSFHWQVKGAAASKRALAGRQLLPGLPAQVTVGDDGFHGGQAKVVAPQLKNGGAEESPYIELGSVATAESQCTELVA